MSLNYLVSNFDFWLISIEFAYQGSVLIPTNVPILQWYVALLTNVYAIPIGNRIKCKLLTVNMFRDQT
jgi:hypothetical protein